MLTLRLSLGFNQEEPEQRMAKALRIYAEAQKGNLLAASKQITARSPAQVSSQDPQLRSISSPLERSTELLS